MQGNICNQTDKKTFEDKKVKFENTYKKYCKNISKNKNQEYVGYYD